MRGAFGASMMLLTAVVNVRTGRCVHEISDKLSRFKYEMVIKLIGSNIHFIYLYSSYVNAETLTI